MTHTHDNRRQGANGARRSRKAPRDRPGHRRAHKTRLARYYITLRPWLWLLSRTSDCRIFQESSVPDIIKEVFRNFGFSDFEERLSGRYAEHEYSVQHRETAFDFVSRLLEEEGIYYFFEHPSEKHVLVLADDCRAHQTREGYEEISNYPDGPATFRERDHARPDYEIYDYPGNYRDHDVGGVYSRMRIEELQAEYETIKGEGGLRGLACGALFNLVGCSRQDQNREYLAVSTEYHIESDEYETTEGVAGPPCRCSFEAIDARQPFRAARITKKPIVQGPQTAVVTGPSGEEIWTDEFGRIKCQFHWDRYGSHDENSSCWIRVSHPWGGQNWGAVSILRIGQEVIVDFPEGDPDQPIVTGRIYNREQMPRYGLPGGKVVSGIKSNSTKGGGGFCGGGGLGQPGRLPDLFADDENELADARTQISAW